jgi:transposase-like protein
MKTHRFTKVTIAAVAAFVIASANVLAGPGPQIYLPVKSHAAAEALKPNTKIAVTCPSCGAVSVSNVGKEKTHLHSFNCSACKHSFEIESVAGGKASAGKLVCKDTTTGKKMPLQMCAEMHGH